jgi:DNA mismatch repair protein MutL
MPRTRSTAISSACSPVSGWLTRRFSISPPSLRAYSGGKTYQVQAAPPYFRPADTPDLITELAQARADGRSENSIAAKQEDLAARVACKVKSVKAGQTLTPEPMKALVKSLLACQSPFSCPHGRPTMVRMSVRHLEGQFDRH